MKTYPDQTFNSFSNIVKLGSSRWQMFFKIGALKNFAIFTGKHLCWTLFLIKIGLAVHIAKISETAIFVEHLRWLLL